MQAEKFFRSLFDYSFSTFVTPRIIKILYVLATIMIALWTLLIVLAAFNVSSGAGFFTLVIVGPLIFLVSMVYARVVLELVIVFFRINGNVQQLRDDRLGGAGATALTPEPPPDVSPALGPAVPTPGPDDSFRAPNAIEAPLEDATVVDAPPEPVPDAEPPSVRYCENCGAERRPESKFCTSCGHA